ncbi:hypothetical protein F4805DRAFT_459700 [Annulohypoxylon moriforme]|nr:hypothetical protein F4805DRAFT_459700 [Annulohypoxylon moriforme]
MAKYSKAWIRENGRSLPDLDSALALIPAAVGDSWTQQDENAFRVELQKDPYMTYLEWHSSDALGIVERELGLSEILTKDNNEGRWIVEQIEGWVQLFFHVYSEP